MFAHKFNKGRRVRLPIRREPIKIFKDRIDAGLFKKSDCIFGIFIEVSIEYPLVHEIRIAADVEEDPSEVVELEWGENKRIASVGAVGYTFNQLTGDTGSGATLVGHPRISAVGPEVGYLFPIGEMQGSSSFRGYWEFAAQNRLLVSNTWLALSITPTQKASMVVK